ncbi:GGDEF domain-containing protein [Candidatus Desantisbacteria bacterium]|nr:GGDEF domain-containing protein [Candidatus Desantisbacteria bacterium]
MVKEKIESQVSQLIKEFNELNNMGILEKDALLSQTNKQIEVILKLNCLLDEKLFELTIINEIGNIIQSVEDYDEVMKSILTILKTIIPYDIGGIILYENSNLDVYINVNKKIQNKYFAECKNKLLDLELLHSEQKLSEKEIEMKINKEIIMGQNNIFKSIKEDISEPLFFYSVPLEIRSRRIGSLFVSIIGKDITEHNKYTLNMVAKQAILVINNCQLYHRMKDMAIHDGLTGLYNHRYLQVSLEREINRAGRHKGSLYLMFIDIDYFKDYNDRFGHQKGDILLQDISKLFMLNVREVDLVSRYGGEEFAIILPYTDKKGALKVAERILLAVRNYPFRGKDDKETVSKTISIGLACFSGKKSKMDLIGQADNALYNAKHSGRNMIKVSEE